MSGIDVTDNECGKKLAEALDGKKIDIVINNAGYFYEPVEKIDTLNFDEEMKMIDICAVGPLRISSALVNANLVPKGGKIVMITSQGGSVAWRTTQNPTGHDYGHHMSKSAANMVGVLLSQELKAKDIVVTILHPGFNKTGMTKKYLFCLFFLFTLDIHFLLINFCPSAPLGMSTYGKSRVLWTLGRQLILSPLSPLSLGALKSGGHS